MIYFWIALGSAIGGAGRYWCNNLVSGAFGNAFPLGHDCRERGGIVPHRFSGVERSPFGPIMAAGIGSARVPHRGRVRGYTTFSAFSLQTLDLLRTGQWPHALGNIGLSVVLCLVAVWLGHLAYVVLGPSRPS